MEMSFPFLLAALFALTFIGNGLIPLPITAYVLWLGQFHMPVPVVLLATLGTVIGALVMEPLFRKAIQHRVAVHHVIPSYYHAFFKRAPGLCLFVFNALPFPWDPSRVLALLHAYPPWRLAVILTVGRLVRYSLLVSIGALLAQYQGLFILVLGVMIGVPILLWGLGCLKPSKSQQSLASQETSLKL